MSRAHVALKLRLAPEVKRTLEALAAHDGVTVSAWVAWQVERTLARAGISSADMPRAGVRGALAKARREAQGRRA